MSQDALGKRRRSEKNQVNRRHNTPKSGVQSYFKLHQTVAVETLQRLLRAPVSLLLSWLVVAIALALPAIFYLLLGNVQTLSQGLDGVPRISLYLSLDTSETQRSQLQKKLQAQPGLSEVRYISPEQALDAFEQESGLAQVVAGLESNPLPPVLSARPDRIDPPALQALEKKLGSWPGVEQVQLDRAWVMRLHNMLQLGQRMAWAIGILLAAGVLLIIGNTIRLAIENRRAEILVVKLVGGSNGYIRRPFLYLGFWLGFGGGVLAAALVGALLAWLDGPLAQLIKLYAGAYRLQGLGLEGVAALLFMGCVLGWLGALLACNRHIRDIEPQ